VNTSSPSDRRVRWLHALPALVLLANLALIAAWPWLAAPVRDWCGRIHACHRIPERCYWVAGEPMAVCARCLGVWVGLFTMATAACLGLRCSPRVALALLLWLIASWVVGAWLPESWHAERTFAGLVGGAGAYALLVRVPGWCERLLRAAGRRLPRLVGSPKRKRGFFVSLACASGFFSGRRQHARGVSEDGGA
jgi:uncharacterized membrane protein